MQADVKVWDEVLRLNLTSAMHLARFALPHITARPGGNIIFMSSLLIRRTVTEDHVGMEAYAASKAGLTAFAHTLFHSLAPYKTKVTSINFGLTATALGMRPPAHHLDFEMQDPGKMIQPEDVAASVVYACRLPHTACPLDIDLAPVGDYAAPQTTKLHAAARL